MQVNNSRKNLTSLSTSSKVEGLGLNWEESYSPNYGGGGGGKNLVMDSIL